MIATDKEVLHMYKSGMSYGTIAALSHCSRQNIHRIVKYKKHPYKFILFGYEISINKL